MQKCNDIAEKLLSAGADSDEVKQHCDGCDTCGDLRRTMQLMERAGAEAAENDMSADAIRQTRLRAIEALEQRPNQIMFLRFRTAIAAAAAVVTALLCTYLVMNMFEKENGGKEMLSPDMSLAELDETILNARQNLRYSIYDFRNKHTVSQSNYEIESLRNELKEKMELCRIDVQKDLKNDET